MLQYNFYLNRFINFLPEFMENNGCQKLNKFSKNNLDSKIAVFRQSPIFAHLSEDEFRKIADLARPHHYAKGEFVFLEGDPPHFCRVVQEGRVKLFKQSFSGKIFTVKVASCGDTLHAVVLFEGEPRWATAQAMDQVTLLRIKERNSSLLLLTVSVYL